MIRLVMNYREGSGLKILKFVTVFLNTRKSAVIYTFIPSVAYNIKQLGGEVKIYISSITDITLFSV